MREILRRQLLYDKSKKNISFRSEVTHFTQLIMKGNNLKKREIYA